MLLTSSNALACLQLYKRAGVYVEKGGANAMWAGRPQLMEGISAVAGAGKGAAGSSGGSRLSEGDSRGGPGQDGAGCWPAARPQSALFKKDAAPFLDVSKPNIGKPLQNSHDRLSAVDVVLRAHRLWFRSRPTSWDLFGARSANERVRLSIAAIHRQINCRPCRICRSFSLARQAS